MVRKSGSECHVAHLEDGITIIGYGSSSEGNIGLNKKSPW